MASHCRTTRSWRAFQDLDAAFCEPPYRSYRAVLAEVMDGFGRRFGFPFERSDRDALAASLPSWRPFADTVEALRALAGCYKLAIISNVDDDLLAASLSRLGIRFDHVITSQQAKCYKPGAGIFEEAARRLDAEPGSVAHVAEGANEVLPATRLGLVNGLGATPWPFRQIPHGNAGPGGA